MGYIKQSDITRQVNERIKRFDNKFVKESMSTSMNSFWLGMCMFISVCLGCGGFYMTLKDIQTDEARDNFAAIYLYSLAALCVFEYIIGSVIIENKKKNNLYKFYELLAIKYTDFLHKSHPELYYQDLLTPKFKNLSQTFRKILIANLKNKEINRLDNIALTIYEQDKNKLKNNQQIESLFNEALQIVLKSLKRNPDLVYLLQEVSKGKKITFFVANNILNKHRYCR